MFLPSFVSYFVNSGVVFGLFLCDGLFWESIVAVCEFDELYCVCVRVVRGWGWGCGLGLLVCRGCMVLV